MIADLAHRGMSIYGSFSAPTVTSRTAGGRYGIRWGIGSTGRGIGGISAVCRSLELRNHRPGRSADLAAVFHAAVCPAAMRSTECQERSSGPSAGVTSPVGRDAP